MATTEELQSIRKILEEIQQQWTQWTRGIDTVLKNVYEHSSEVITASETKIEQLVATTRAVKKLADKLTLSEQRQQDDDRTLAQVVGALAAVAGNLDKLRTEIARERDPATWSADEIANRIDFSVLCAARQIAWARRGALDAPAALQDPEPLPPPSPAVEHRHRRKEDSVPGHKHRRKDDSMSFQLEQSGRRRRLTLTWGGASPLVKVGSVGAAAGSLWLMLKALWDALHGG